MDSQEMLVVECELLGGEGERHPDLRFAHRRIEISRLDADHRVAVAAQADGAAQDGRVSPEAAFPQALGQEDHAVRSRHVLVDGERATEHGTDPEDIEPAAGHALAGGALGRVDVVAQVEARVRLGREVRELCGAGAPIAEVAGGHAAWVAAPDGLDRDGAIAVDVGQRLQDHGPDQAEDRAGRADAERQRERRDGREPGAAAKLANRVLRVLAERGEPARARRLAIALLPLLFAFGADAPEVPELRQRLPARLFLAHSLGHIFADAHIQVELELGIDLLLDGGLPEKGSKLLAYAGHGALRSPKQGQAASSTLDTAADQAAHWRVSCLSCARPSRVRL